MAKKKPTEPPTDKPTAISLAPRVEAKTDTIKITADQAMAQINAAHAKYELANVYDREAMRYAAAAKEKKNQAEAARAEAQQIIDEAAVGTMTHPISTIVERHPTHEAEWIRWRLPEGMKAEDLLDAGPVEGVERYDARLAQGCIEWECFAMKPEEIDAVKRDSWSRANPGLPFPDVVGAKKIAEMTTPSGAPVDASNVLAFPGRPVAAADQAVIEEMGASAKVEGLASDIAALGTEERAEALAAAGLKETALLYRERNADGWPKCPRCGNDELWSPAIPPTENTIIHCNDCGWRPPVDVIPTRHLAALPADTDEAYEALPASEDTRTEPLFAAPDDSADEAPPAEDDDHAPPDLDEAPSDSASEEHAADETDKPSEEPTAEPGWCERVRRNLSAIEVGEREATCGTCGKPVKVKPVVDGDHHVATLPRHKTQASQS